MFCLSRSALMLMLLAISAPARADMREAPPGALSCSGCHATSSGVSTPVPPLNGRTSGDIVAAMQGYKSGQLPATVMDRLAKGFSDAEIQAIADWYALK